MSESESEVESESESESILLSKVGRSPSPSFETERKTGIRWRTNWNILSVSYSIHSLRESFKAHLLHSSTVTSVCWSSEPSGVKNSEEVLFLSVGKTSTVYEVPPNTLYRSRMLTCLWSASKCLIQLYLRVSFAGIVLWNLKDIRGDVGCLWTPNPRLIWHYFGVSLSDIVLWNLRGILRKLAVCEVPPMPCTVLLNIQHLGKPLSTCEDLPNALHSSFL